jgi:fluoride exporter
MDKYLIVMAGGAVGSLARYVAGTAIMSRFAGRFPLGTLAVNATGCFLIGAIMTLLARQSAPHPNLRLLLVVGFLGGYTTFSSFAYETFLAAREGSPWIGLLNVVASVVLGYIAVWLGAISMDWR